VEGVSGHEDERRWEDEKVDPKVARQGKEKKFMQTMGNEKRETECI
jgi:hypothetical protein